MGGKCPYFVFPLSQEKDEQAGAGAVPSSGLVNSLVKIELFFLLEIENKTHDEF